MNGQDKNKEILMYDGGLFNLRNSQNISKIKNRKKFVF